jgi:hypothetical protein
MRRLFDQYGIATVFFSLAAVLGLTAPHFLTVENFRNVAVQVPVTTIIAVGMTFVILTGGIDLSVGSIHALAGVLLALALTTPGLTERLGPAVVPVSLLFALAVGTGVGWFNGAAVAWFRMPPFIVTLATMRICRGLAKKITDGVPVGMSDLPGAMGERLNRNLDVARPVPERPQQALAFRVVQDTLQAHPNLRGIFGINDDCALGALRAVEATRRRGICIVGFDATPAAVERIRAGSALRADAAQFPTVIGRATIDAILKHASGQPVPRRVQIPTGLVARRPARRVAFLSSSK